MNLINVLIIGYFSQEAKERIINYFPEGFCVSIVEPGEESKGIQDCHILIPEHIQVNREILSQGKQLRLVQTGAGFDNVHIEDCTEAGVWVANAAGVNSTAVAEHVMALMLSYFKNIPHLDQFMKSGGNEKHLFYQGAELEGKTMGIMGFGAIGKKVAKYANAFGMKVITYDKFLQEKDTLDVEFVEEDTLLRESDVLSAHIFLNQDTKKYFNMNRFLQMKNDAVFINTARGGIVDELDLINALENHIIGGACLDVFQVEPLELNNRLRKLNNVLLTPHTAGMPDGLKFHKKRYDFFIRNIQLVCGEKAPLSNLNVIS